MTRFELFKVLYFSYNRLFRLVLRTLGAGPSTPARLSPRRVLIMALFLPLFLMIQSLNWLCLLLDEILFPGYRQVPVNAPLFVVGVPRSGTTFMHRVLAEDTRRFTTLSLWELVLAPAIIQRKCLFMCARLDRMLGAPGLRLIRWVEHRVFGSIDAIHRISLFQAEEDYFLLAPVWASFILILPFPFTDVFEVPAYFDQKMPRNRQDLILKFYTVCIQRHLYCHGQGRKVFLSKNVSFTPMMAALHRHFPDCGMVAMVRNPLKAVPSHISSMTAGARVFGNPENHPQIRRLLVGLQRYGYTRIMTALPRLNPHRHRIIPMERLKPQLFDTVMDIYHAMGYEMDQAMQNRLAELSAAQGEYKSGHTYHLEGLGLDAGRIYEEFSDVFDAFGYPPPHAL